MGYCTMRRAMYIRLSDSTFIPMIETCCSNDTEGWGFFNAYYNITGENNPILTVDDIRNSKMIASFDPNNQRLGDTFHFRLHRYGWDFNARQLQSFFNKGIENSVTPIELENAHIFVSASWYEKNYDTRRAEPHYERIYTNIEQRIRELIALHKGVSLHFKDIPSSFYQSHKGKYKI